MAITALESSFVGNHKCWFKLWALYGISRYCFTFNQRYVTEPTTCKMDDCKIFL